MSATSQTVSTATDDVVEAAINYVTPMNKRAKFHAQDARRDNLILKSHVMQIRNARAFATAPSLDREGFALASQRTSVKNFHDREELSRVYLPELQQFLLEYTGAVRVTLLGAGGLVRYAERSSKYGTGINTRPARFPHVDFTDRTAPGLVEDVFGARQEVLRPGERILGLNIWRVISDPPQDVPLAVCDSRTVTRRDLIPADGVYDVGDPETWMELEAYVVAHNPAHRWAYFRDMHRDEVLLFRSYDSGPGWRAGVPHSAFDDPTCPADAPARVSIEARAIVVLRD
jgi:hypothetical protein